MAKSSDENDCMLRAVNLFFGSKQKVLENIEDFVKKQNSICKVYQRTLYIILIIDNLTILLIHSRKIIIVIIIIKNKICSKSIYLSSHLLVNWA